MKKITLLLYVIFLTGCKSPFEINHAPAAQVVIACYDGLPVQVGDTLSAVFPDLNDRQIEQMDIRYTWYRDDEKAAPRTGDEHPQSDTDTEYTVKVEDLRTSIKVKASFKYNNTVSAAVIGIDVSTAGSFAELQALLASAGKVNSQELTTTGDFAVTQAISIPANTTLIINTAVTADNNITIQGTVNTASGSLTVNPSRHIALVSGGTLTVNAGGNVYLGGELDNSNGTIANNGTFTVESGGVLVKRPVWGPDDNGKYVVNRGGRITGYIGSGGAIDNYSSVNEIALTKSGFELVSGNINIVSDWIISDILTVNGNITVNNGKDIRGIGTEPNPDNRIIVKSSAAVSGGASDLTLGEGTYTWSGSDWVLQ